MHRLPLLRSLARSIPAAAAFALLLCSVVSAQEDANVQRGFAAEKVYAFGEVDSVNLFNGNLVLTLPIGNEYPVNGGLSYGLKLIYNSNIWDFQTRTDTLGTYTWTQVSPAFNAGVGWTLSLGRMFAPHHPDNPSAYGAYTFVGEDGGTHELYSTLHVGETGSTGTLYSRDGSYLRLKLSGYSSTTGNYSTAEVQSPDGTVRRFYRASTDWATPFRLQTIRDPFGNTVTVSYPTSTRWTITDGHRTHHVDFAARTVDGQTVQYVASVTLAAFGATTATYGFTYTNLTFDRHGQDTDPTTGTTTTAPVLTAVSLPDGSAWRMPLHHTTVATGPGLIQRLELPTLGKIDWTWRTYTYPQRSDGVGGETLSLTSNYGVATKRVLNAAGSCETWDGVGCQWTYTPEPFGGLPVLRRTVTMPTGDETVHHFSVPLNVNYTTWKGWEYGLPFTTATSDGAGRFLSQEIYDGTVAAGVKKRSIYLRYEHDKIPAKSETTYIQDWYNTNRRVASEKTVYHDDGGKYAEVTHSQFDGLGRYRHSLTSGTFAAGNQRTAYTGFNPASGVYLIDPATNTNATGHTYQPLSQSAPWILGTHDQSWQQEGSQARRYVHHCYDANTGFLLRKRVLAGTSPAANDVVSVHVHSLGNVTRESTYGGDVQTLGTGALCGLSLPTPKYRVDHTYAKGVRITSRSFDTAANVAMPYYDLELQVDANTALPTWSEDVSGIRTTFSYDGSGRLTWEKPDPGHGAWVQYRYNRATSSSALANVEIFSRPNGSTSAVLAQSRVWFDFMGRVWRDQKLGEDGTWSTVDTVWNSMGWKRSVSERQPIWPNRFTVYKSFDPFGRPGVVEPPDGTAHKVELFYAGVREVSRKTRVRTATADEEVVTTVERYDRQGRLHQVVEPSGTSGANVTTTYGYESGGRLSSVSIAGGTTQTRTFSYDGRGFLLWERHPEKGASGNGYVRYLSYDPRGNPGQKMDAVATAGDTIGAASDVLFVYDGAGRLMRVRRTSDSADLKVFTYGTSGGTGNWALGKVTRADRYNHVQIGTTPYTIQVAETYTYGGVGGRPSARSTQVYVNGGAYEAFTQAWTWTELGDEGTVTAPRCTHSGCTGAAATARVITNGHRNGYLNKVTDSTAGLVLGTLTYHPNGLVKQVSHGNGTVWNQALDPNGMGRPASYSVTYGTTNLWLTGTYAFDGTGNVKAIGSSSFIYDRVSRLVSSTVYTGATGGGTAKAQSASFDPYGNVLSLTTVGSTLYTPTAASTNRLTSAGVTYDSAGAMTEWNGNKYESDPFGMIWRVKASGIEYVHLYTADDERIWTFQPGAPSRWTLRGLDNQVLRELSNNAGTWTVQRDYAYRGGAVLAARTPSEVTYLHPDHLGTPRLVTGNSGAVRAYHVYHPFGTEATSFNQDTERLKFTAHERDLGITTSIADDLDYMHARFYNMQIGRFLSVDPILGSPKTPQSWNRYAYVQGNPMRNIDPTGELTGSAMAEAAQGAIRELKDEATYGLSDGSVFGIVASTALGTAFDTADMIVDVLRVGESTGEAVGSGAGILETTGAIVTDTLRGAAIVAPAAGALWKAGAQTAGKGFHSFAAFKRAHGRAGDGLNWHHLVEQTPGNLSRFGPEVIHNTQNLMRLDVATHRQISAYYSRIQPFTQGQTVRQWLSTQRLSAQREFGLQTLRDFGVTP